MSADSQRFTSIGFPISIDLGLGRVFAESSYAAHVDQLIRQVLLTNPGERVNRPDFGCGIRRMLFAPNSDVATTLLQASVMQALDRWLGTVIKVESVKTVSNDSTVEVRLAYTLLARQQRRYLNIQVSP